MRSKLDVKLEWLAGSLLLGGLAVGATLATVVAKVARRLA